jgi:hypothetical protein
MSFTAPLHPAIRRFLVASSVPRPVSRAHRDELEAASDGLRPSHWRFEGANTDGTSSPCQPT